MTHVSEEESSGSADGAGGGWSEDGLHRWLAAQPWPATLAGSRGHDAAVLKPLFGRPVVCADQCIEGVHFLRGVGGEAAGRKAVLRTLSDLAATAARPAAVTLTLSAPAETPAAWIRSALEGANAAATEHGAELVAGDLAMSSGPIALSVTALGSVSGEVTPVGRDRASAGEVVVVSGALGGSLGSGRHLRPVPRLEEGIAIAAAGATAMMDVSDGLVWDVYRLARASGVTVELDLGAVPVHADAVVRAEEDGAPSGLDQALGDGEDHELVATLSRAAWDAFRGSAAGSGWTRIGDVVRPRGEGEAWLVLRGGGDVREWSPAEKHGYRHGETFGDGAR